VTSAAPDLFDVFGASARTLHEALLGRCERNVMTRGDGRAFTGQRILITGAAGFIGAALARRIVRFKPAQLTLMDQSDSGLVRLEMELQTGVPLNLVLGDVSRISDVRNTVRDARPNVVFHAAAAGRVALAERAVCATVRTNVFGTVHVARETSAAGARLVLISTRDAETAPTLVGATRRLAELVSMCPKDTGFRPIIVRLGHMLELPAGPVHTWLEQLRSGRPLHVADAAAPQALMTVREAVSLMLKADLLGGPGQVFQLDSGDPSLSVDVARRLLAWASDQGLASVPLRGARLPRTRRSGAEPVSGLRFTSVAGHAGVQFALQRTPDTLMMSRILRALREDLRRRDALTALADLRAAIPGFLPSSAAREEATAATLHLTGVTWRPVQPLAA
jgi:FlaA1/EpsC-like NDP-sugar epimerase